MYLTLQRPAPLNTVKNNNREEKWSQEIEDVREATL